MEVPSAEVVPQQTGARGLGARFWTLIAATFLAFSGIGTVLPGMALHVRHDLGGSDQTVGFVIGTFSVVALASRFISGPLADRKGRKVAFLVGLASCSVAGMLYLMPLGIAGMFLGRGMQGFGEACLYTGAAAWAVEAAGMHRSGRALGFVSTGIWGGFAVGPVIGQWLGSFERAATMQVVMAIAGFALLSRVPENYEPHPSPGKRRWLPKELIASGFAIGLANVQYPVVTGFLILHMAQTGGSGPTAYSAYALMVLLSRFFLGGLPDRIPPQFTFYGGLASMAAGLALLAFVPGPITSLAGALLLGFGFAFPWSSIASVVMRRAASHERGSTVGVLSAFVDLFVGTSSFAAGALAQRFGYSAAFMLALGGVALSGLVGTQVFSKRAARPQ
ncbi:MAG: MFS transporter [Bryobacteraceae bacterium]